MAEHPRVIEVRSLSGYPAFLRALRAFYLSAAVTLVSLVVVGKDANSWLYLVPIAGLAVVVATGTAWYRLLRTLREESTLNQGDLDSAAMIAGLRDLVGRRGGSV